MPRVLGGPKGGGRFLMGEDPLYLCITRLEGLILSRHTELEGKICQLWSKNAPRAARMCHARGYLTHKKTPTPLGPP